jgi:hypothetical protein
MNLKDTVRRIRVLPRLRVRMRAPHTPLWARPALPRAIRFRYALRILFAPSVPSKRAELDASDLQVAWMNIGEAAFDREARAAVEAAYREALCQDAAGVRTDHLLVGLVLSPRSPVGELLARHGVAPVWLRRTSRELPGDRGRERLQREAMKEGLHLDASAQRALLRAVRFSGSAADEAASSQDILCSLLAEPPESPVMQLLRELGLDVEELRRESGCGE